MAFKDNFKNFLVSSSAETPGLGWFLIIAIAIHLFDAFKFGFSPGSFLLMTVPYLALTIFGIFLIFKPGDPKAAMKIALVSLLAIAIPRAIVWGLKETNIGVDSAASVLMAVPIWLLYLYFSREYSNPRIQKWGGIYFVVFLIIGLTYLVPNLSEDTGLSNQGIDSENAKRGLADFFSPRNVKDNLFSWRSNVQDYVDKSLGINYFAGTVEDNKDGELGVYLENLYPSSPVFYEGNSIVVWATIRGKSFDNEIITKNSCYAKYKDVRMPGVIYPIDLSLAYDSASTLECRFDDDSGNILDEGTYSVFFQSMFGFETWAYVTYSYVTKDTQRAFFMDNKDINVELDIDREVAPVYTSGPAALKMIDLSMPIAIDTVDPKHPNFGVTLTNRWPQGDLVTIKSLKIHAPNHLELHTCIPNAKVKGGEASSGDLKDLDYKTYTFELEGSELTDEKYFFRTVTCRVDFKEPEKFFEDKIKRTDTFAVEAIYTYLLEKSTRVIVEESAI